MAIDNNEVDECGTGRESPPSYTSSLRQISGAHTQNFNPAINLNTINNRNGKNCVLCQYCHKERALQSKETTQSLGSIVDILETCAQLYQNNYLVTIVCLFWFGLVYCFVYWLCNAPPPYIIEEEYQRAFINANISEDIQKILLEGAKKRMVEDFKQCILTKL